MSKRNEMIEQAEAAFAEDMAVIKALRKGLDLAPQNNRDNIRWDVLDDSDGTGRLYIDLDVGGRPYRLNLERIE